MSLSFFVGLALHAVLTTFISPKRSTPRRGLIAWRITTVLAVLALALTILAPPDTPVSLAYGYTALFLFFFVTGFIVTPLLSPIAACETCGRRAWWVPIFTSRCPHCGHILYEAFPGE